MWGCAGAEAEYVACAKGSLGHSGVEAQISGDAMTDKVVQRRSSASQVLDSPLRHVAAAIAVSSGFAYVLEAEDQFHRAIWFGVLFAAITGGWFIIGSFLTLVDTRAAWQLLVALSVGSLALWGVGQFVEASEAVDDVGDVSEPLTQVRLAAALLLIALGVLALRGGRHRLLHSGRAAAVAGLVVFVLGILGTVVAATVQSFSAEGDCGPEQVQAGRSECADS
jgi:hypothetical protein